MTQPSPVEQIAFPAFKRAAGEAGVFELRLRLLCDSEDATAKHALKSKLKDVLKEVLKHWGRHITDEQAERLGVCVKLRNKVFHQELSATRGHLIELGTELKRVGVWKMDLATGESVDVTKTSTVNGKLYGWLLVGATSGAFDRCVELFEEGMELLCKARDAALQEAIGDLDEGPLKESD